MTDLEVSLVLKADSQGLVGQVRLSKQELDRLSTAGRDAGKGLGRYGREAKKAGTATKNLNHQSRDLQSQFRGLKAAIAGLGLGLAAREMFRAGAAMQGIESALLAVFKTTRRARSEFQFIQTEAERLGLNLESAASQYSKLAAAADGTALAGEPVREIFIAVSEAARVFNLSVADTSGALRAFQQIISKGNVQAEELRNQLGDRIYGAFNKAAAAIGVTVEQLNDLLQAGEVTAEKLLPPLARELRKAAAPGLPKALQNATTEMERLGNAATLLKRDFNQGGFMADLAEATRDLTQAMRSPALRQFSHALGGNVAALTAAVGGFAAGKLGVLAYGAAVRSAAASTGTLTKRLKGLLSRFNVLGLALAALSFLSFKDSDAERAIERHSANFEDLGEKATTAAKAVANIQWDLDKERVAADITYIEDEISRLHGALAANISTISGGDALSDGVAAGLDLVRKDMEAGLITADEYSHSVQKILAQNNDLLGKGTELTAQQIEHFTQLRAAVVALTNAQIRQEELAKQNPNRPKTDIKNPAPRTAPEPGEKATKIIAELKAEAEAVRILALARLQGQEALQKAEAALAAEAVFRGEAKDATAAQRAEIEKLITTITQAEAAEESRQKTLAEHEAAVKNIKTQLVATLPAYERARAAANQWHRDVVAGLDPAVKGYQQLKAQADEVHRRMLANADEGIEKNLSFSEAAARGFTQFAEAAQNAAGTAERVVTGAFSGMESALAQFLVTGKITFTSFVNSILVDIARLQIRQSITGPLASVLGGALGGVFGGSPAAASAGGGLSLGGGFDAAFDLFHSGGIVGQMAARRQAAITAFQDAPRLHSGGRIAGLRSGEVPIIAQTGEAVFTPQQMNNADALLRAALARPTGGVTVAVNIQQPAGLPPARVEHRDDGQGGLEIDVVIEEITDRLNDDIERGGGLYPVLAKRFTAKPGGGGS